MRAPPIRTLLRDRRTGIRELNKYCHDRGGYYGFNPAGEGIFSLDWDNLIILDACRHDIYRERVKSTDYLSTEGLASRRTLGSNTPRFIRANFTERDSHDLVYVGGNNWYLNLQEEINSTVFRFIDLQTGEDDVRWAHEDLDVVMPETVTRHALNAERQYPNKRLLVHYLQPHHPFLGEVGREHFDHPNSSLSEVVKHSDQNSVKNHLKEAYVENLNIVLEELPELISGLSGRTVITADHGEMLGDDHQYFPIADYGHIRKIWNDETTRVPWHVVKDDSRKKITKEQPENLPDVTQEQIDKKLHNLGYKV